MKPSIRRLLSFWLAATLSTEPVQGFAVHAPVWVPAAPVRFEAQALSVRVASDLDLLGRTPHRILSRETRDLAVETAIDPKPVRAIFTSVRKTGSGNPSDDQLMSLFWAADGTLTRQMARDLLPKIEFKGGGPMIDRLIEEVTAYRRSQSPPSSVPRDADEFEELYQRVRTRLGLTPGVRMDFAERSHTSKVYWATQLLEAVEAELVRPEYLHEPFVAYFRYAHPWTVVCAATFASRIDKELFKCLLGDVGTRMEVIKRELNSPDDKRTLLASGLYTPGVEGENVPLILRFFIKAVSRRISGSEDDFPGFKEVYTYINAVIPFISRHLGAEVARPGNSDNLRRSIPDLANLERLLPRGAFRVPEPPSAPINVPFAMAADRQTGPGPQQALLRVKIQSLQEEIEGTSFSNESAWLKDLVLPAEAHRLLDTSLKSAKRDNYDSTAFTRVATLGMFLLHETHRGAYFDAETIASFERLLSSYNQARKSYNVNTQALSIPSLLSFLASPFAEPKDIPELLGLVQSFRWLPEPYATEVAFWHACVQGMHGPPSYTDEEVDPLIALELLEQLLPKWSADPSGPRAEMLRIAIGLLVLSHYDESNPRYDALLRQHDPEALAVWMTAMAQLDWDLRGHTPLGVIQRILGDAWLGRGMDRPIDSYFRSNPWNPRTQEAISPLKNIYYLPPGEIPYKNRRDYNAKNPFLLMRRYQQIIRRVTALSPLIAHPGESPDRPMDGLAQRIRTGG